MRLRYTCILVLIVQYAYCQNRIYFEEINFNINSDFSIVSSIDQDSLGYIWAATEEGLIRYNSLKAYHYNEYIGLPTSFSNKITKVIVDANNDIWAISDNKLAVFDSKINSFQEISLPSKVGLIYDINIADNNIYIAAFNGLFILDKDDTAIITSLLDNTVILALEFYENEKFIGTKNGLYHLNANQEVKQLLDDYEIFSILKVDRELILGTQKGSLLKYSLSTNSFNVVDEFDHPIYDILYNKVDNKYYIATDGAGLYIYENNLASKTHHLYDANYDNSLSSNGIYDLLLDNDGQVWIATYGGGVNKIKTKGTPFQLISHVINDNQSLGNNFTRAILETKEGEIWYGTKEGLSIYDLKNKKWEHIKSFLKNEKADIILALEEDGEYVWVGTFGNGAFKVNKKDLTYIQYSSTQSAGQKTSIDKVYAILRAENGDIWMGGIGGPLHQISKDKISTYPVSQIRDIKQSPDGNIYSVGRSGMNLMKNGEVKLMSDVYYQNTELDYSTINCLLFENNNNVWIGTNGDGILRYNINENKYTAINISNGLPSDVIQGMILNQNNLWVSTSSGLAKMNINQETLNIQIYDTGDGLPTNSFNYGSYAKLSSGKYAFGSTKGVVQLDPEKLPITTKPPNVVFEYIDILTKDNEKNGIIFLESGIDEGLKFDYLDNYLKINFIGIDHSHPEKIRYSWRMNGVNEDWMPPSKITSVNLAGLQPGKYTFEVKAYNRDNDEGNVSSLPIKINPPWWHSNIAYFIYFLFFLGIMASILSIVRALLKKKNAEEKISFYNNITHELKTPLSILVSKLDKASEKSENMGEIKSTIRRLNGLFDQLLNYNKISSDYYQNQKVSKISFEKHIKIITDTFKEDIEKKEISLTFDNQWPHPYFYYKRDVLDKITFNLISNAIKYSTQGGSIQIIAKAVNDNLSLTIKDNGIGIPEDQKANILKRYYRARNAVNSQTPGTGLGLMIVKNLVESDNGEISFTSQEGLGTAFTVVLKSMEDNYVDENVSPIIDQEIEINDNSGNKKYKILVVEDNDELRIDLVEKLSEYYSIMAARNGVEALNKVKAKLPDLILTDHIMPEMDGNQLCRELQGNVDTNHIPVFMMTVLNSNTQKVESIKSGITTYMTKPLDFSFLIAKINSTFEYKQKLREKYLHAADVDKANKFKDDRDAEFIKKMEDFIINKVKEESISVQDLCKHMGMSRTALYMKLKEMIDMSLQNFIITTKMNHARRLLLKGGLTVKEVAYQVGFTNPKYFSTSFKKQFGMSPSGFLKSLNPV